MIVIIYSEIFAFCWIFLECTCTFFSFPSFYKTGLTNMAKDGFAYATRFSNLINACGMCSRNCITHELVECVAQVSQHLINV